jgi:hypothetical protein
MARLCFDYGHGGNDPGAVYKGRKEADDVLSLGRAVAAVLRRHGVIIDETRTADVSVSLKARCDFENKGAVVKWGGRLIAAPTLLAHKLYRSGRVAHRGIPFWVTGLRLSYSVPAFRASLMETASTLLEHNSLLS